MILDGRTVANYILAELTNRVDELDKKYGIIPHLAVIRVGDNAETTSYILQKEKKAKEIGAVVSVYKHPENISQKELQQTIDYLQHDPSIHGIILQLPIPTHLNTDHLIAGIHPEKDVDGFVAGSPFMVPLAAAIFKLLEVPCVKETATTGESYNEWLASKRIVVMGKGKTGGQPIIDALRKRGLTPDVVDSQTPNPSLITKTADIIIVAVGLPAGRQGRREYILDKDMIKKDVILLGVGMKMDEEGKFYGDYDEKDIQDIASWYTPTPGGVGPVNVACLMENVVRAAEMTIKN